ncbi:hypothetical protein IFM89_020050 [Coptis chinensis]|uniref:DNA-directed RNA polymerase III subunit RPC9 n=1 Tax=Coptis chinensis TaxID=261450 RepID=A0A835J109_9MAGN|nr:hypothetical protein IFM89_020050 [Coptis chinensis]
MGPTRVIANVAPTEFQVQSVARNQTRESIDEFLTSCIKFDLAKAEKLNLINIRPSSAAEIDSIVENCEQRMGNENEALVKMIIEMFPTPGKPEGTDEDPTERCCQSGSNGSGVALFNKAWRDR